MNYSQSMKLKYRNYGAPWTPELDHVLAELFKEGKTIEQLMMYFGRNEGGIIARLKEMYLIDPYSISATPKYNPQLIVEKEKELKKAIDKITYEIKEKYEELSKKQLQLLELAEKKTRQNMEYETLDKLLQVALDNMVDNGWYDNREQALRGTLSQVV